MVQQSESSASIPDQGQRFSASSLLDMNALPSWMREGDAEQGTTPGAAYEDVQGQAQRGGSAPQSQQWQQQALPPYPQSPLPMQTPPGSSVNQAMGNNAPQGSLSAASFIDKTALPEWLRSEAELRQPSQTSPVSPPPSAGNMPQAASRPGPYAVSPRAAENVRVPSRPRGEMGAPESNEVAANVFSSMLGVASNAPQFPPSAQGMPQGQRPAQQGAQPGMPPTQYGLQGQMPGAFPPGVPPQQVPQGYPPGAYNPYPGSPGNVQSHAQMRMSPTMIPPQGQPNSTGMPPMGSGMTGEPRGNARPAKRNLFEAIRNWLFGTRTS
jgi:hypothetical protein